MDRTTSEALATGIRTIPYFAHAARTGEVEAACGTAVYMLHDYLLDAHQSTARAMHAALPGDGGAILCGRALFSRTDVAILVKRAFRN